MADAAHPDPSSPPTRPLEPGAPPAPGADADEAIPMLTEIVQMSRPAADALPKAPGDADWAEFGERVLANVTERLTRDAQALLDTQLRDALQAAVDRAAESLAAELRASLSHRVRDAVSRAIAEELTRMQAGIARRDEP